MEVAEDSVWLDLSGLPADPPTKRDVCSGCNRPSVVCWCSSLPATPIQTESRVILLQHPAEEKRCLRTAPMLARALAPGHCLVFRGKRFPQAKHQGLQEILEMPNSILLYPSRNAVDLNKFPKVPETRVPYNLILIDGTWPQAKGIYYNTPALQNMKQAKLRDLGTSSYVIRSQPTDGCLSTLETAAEALSVVEGRDVREPLLRPLKALCDHQLRHGAVIHHSTECKLNNPNLPTKRIGKRLSKFLKQLDSPDL